MQFSKIVVISSYTLMIVSLVAAIFIPGFSETIAIAFVASCGTILATTLVFYLKKAQAENTMKIYLSAYREITEIKKENNEDVSEFLDNAEENFLNKMTNTLDTSLDDATSQIEVTNVNTM